MTIKIDVLEKDYGYDATITVSESAFLKIMKLFDDNEDKALNNIEDDVIERLNDFYEEYKENTSNDKIESEITIATAAEEDYFSYSSETLVLKARINDYEKIEGTVTKR